MELLIFRTVYMVYTNTRVQPWTTMKSTVKTLITMKTWGVSEVNQPSVLGSESRVASIVTRTASLT